MKRTISGIVVSILGIGMPQLVSAHCPLCTAGAVAIGLGAYQLGVSTLSVGIALGAAALALGLWMAKLIPGSYFRGQRLAIAFLVFATTILPVAPFLPGARGLYLAGIGQYGTTLMIPNVLIGAVLGGLIVLVSTRASRILAKLRSGRHVPFQGALVVVVLLAAVLAFIEVTT